MIREIGSQIRTMRKVQKLTMRELARRVGMSPGSLSEIERDLQEPGIYTVVKIAKELHMTVDTLLSVHIDLCPACEGNGVKGPIHYTHLPPCDLCGGTGRVVIRLMGEEISE